MRFRPCIDIHNGSVKQIVGSSLKDTGDMAEENFVSKDGARAFADLYKQHELKGGHIVLLNAIDSPYYNSTKQQAIEALKEYPGGLQIGGGIRPDNAEEFLNAGASHVIVTSYVFKDGKIDEEKLDEMVRAVGKKHLVLDLSCRKKEDKYYVVTDRWQKFTDYPIDYETMNQLSESCDEFLVHAVDVEGKQRGIESELISILGKITSIPVTYAGGISDMEDIHQIQKLSDGKLDFTIGSALDLFGGRLPFRDVIRWK